MDENLSLPALPPQVTPPRVTVILIAHNQEGALRRAIESLELSQRREQVEILVVDCASTDDTPSLAEAFPNVTMQRLPHHFGATKALNIATRTARGEFLFLLSPDAEATPGLIGELADRLESTGDAAAVTPLLVDSTGQPATRHLQPLPTPESLGSVCEGREGPVFPVDLTQESVAVPYAGREALMVRKQFVAGMNYFDERFGEYWADADLAMKIRQAGKKIRLYPAIRATWHAAHKAPPTGTLYTADRIAGAAALLGKYKGFLASFRFTWAAILKALMRLDFSLASALLGGSRLGGQTKQSYPN
jgi:GT2 family glycosyltransferase